jgi:solute:Na+ symporter, SSS family
VALLDYVVLGAYLALVMGIGVYFLLKQTRPDEYFVGDRKMGAGHVGLSVVATDVGGGFSIGLGALGFTMGMSGSWLLFTGLVGAWLAAVLLIPKVKPLGQEKGWMTFPDFLAHRFDGRTRLMAAIVSGVGYAAFVGSQVVAGAALTHAAFGIDLSTAVWIVAAVVLLYTAFGGLQAVIYTDTLQWIVLIAGLGLVAVPLALSEVGGFAALRESVPAEHLSFTNIGPMTFLAWMVTIIPIWFVANTLYQRIYATRDVKTAKRAWYFAGLLEWPVIAILAVSLGVFARALYPDLDSGDLALPRLIVEILPVGVTGLVIAVYFAAIMSTADSCLLASVGNFVNDIYQKYLRRDAGPKEVLWVGRGLALGLGLVSVLVAMYAENVLSAIFLAYGFMAAGLFVPALAGLVWKRATAAGAFWSMTVGGSLTILITLVDFNPFAAHDLGTAESAILVALPIATAVMIAVSLLGRPPAREAADEERAQSPSLLGSPSKTGTQE